MRTGRPTKYEPEYCERLIQFMAEGFSFEAFAGELRISKKTLYNWLEENEDFLHAKDEGFQLSRLWWERVGRQIAQKNKGNATAFIFNMKNRFKEDWRDRHEVEQTGNITINWNEQKNYNTK